LNTSRIHTVRDPHSTSRRKLGRIGVHGHQLASLPVRVRPHTSAYVRFRQHASAYCDVSIRQHTSAYVSIRQHTSAYVSIRQHTSAYVSIRQHTSAYVRIRQHTSEYVSIRQHTSAYVSMRLLSHLQNMTNVLVMSLERRPVWRPLCGFTQRSFNMFLRSLSRRIFVK
jgi:hypothetical protein